MAIVYCTTNLVNGKKYIGSTNEWRKSYLGSGVYLKQALAKYGRENFVRQVLWKGDDKHRWDMENYWLDYFDCANNKLFYNASEQAGGSVTTNLGRTLSEEHKEAISKAGKGRPAPRSSKLAKSKYLVKVDGTDWLTTGELAKYLGHKNRSTVTRAIKYALGNIKPKRNPPENSLVSQVLNKNFKIKRREL